MMDIINIHKNPGNKNQYLIFIIFVGMVSDVTGNYDTSFVLGGCFIAFAGLVVFISKHCGKHKLYNISVVT